MDLPLARPQIGTLLMVASFDDGVRGLGGGHLYRTVPQEKEEMVGCRAVVLVVVVE